MIGVLTITWVFIVIGVYMVKSTMKPKKFPPGPRWLPFIGSSDVVVRMEKKHGSQWKGFSVLAKQYSTELLGLKLAGELLVVVYGDKYIRQAYTEKEFDGRPKGFFFLLRCFGKKTGITFNDGHIWREQRQFMVKQFRNMGFGKPIMEVEIEKQMNNMVDYFLTNRNKPVNPRHLLASMIVNIIWKYIAGESINQERLNVMLDLMNARSKAFSIEGGWLNQMPWCRFLFPELTGYTTIVKINKQVSDLIGEAVKKHVNNEINSNDFMQTFLEESKQNGDNFTVHQLTTICMDLLIAGSQTSSTVLEFSILTMLRNQDIQQKLYDEINNNIGDRTPTWDDTHKLNYTCAFIQEIHRVYTIVPLAGPRRLLKDTCMGEYIIPKDTTILLATGDLHRDPELWEQPNEFRPERFLDESGKVINPEHLYPYSLGRRRCPGQPLAQVYIFLILVRLIQQFKVTCSDGVMPSGEPIVKMFASPKPYTALFHPRFEIN